MIGGLDMHGESSFSLGFALSGGTLRAAAHIGVLEVLQASGITADIIAGTSGGGLIAAIYAAGYQPSWMAQLAATFPGAKLVDWSVPFKQVLKWIVTLPLYYLHVIKNPKHLIPIGLIKGDKLEQYVQNILSVTPTQSPIPMLLVTTDLIQNQTVIYYSKLNLPKQIPAKPFRSFQELGDWVGIGTEIEERFLPILIRASCAIPGVLEPVRIGNRTLVDGGIRDYLPVNLLYALGVKKVIAVDLHKTEIDAPIETFLDVVNRSLDILLDQVTLYRMESCKPFVLTPKIDHVKWTSFDRILACVDAGREEALKKLPEIKDYLNAT
jgi:NTE family protein